MGKGTVHYGFGVKGGLRKEDQQFGEWLRANSVRGVRKSVKVIASASHTQALWWRKPGSKAASSQSQFEEASSQSLKVVGWGKEVGKEIMMRNIGGLNLNLEESNADLTPSVLKIGRQSFSGNKGCDQVASTLTTPLGDYSNRSQTLTPPKLSRKWTKIARAPSTGKHSGPLLMETDRRPSVDQEEE